MASKSRPPAMEDVLSKARRKLAALARRSDKFLEEQDGAFEAAKVVARVVYGCAKAAEGGAAGHAAMDALPELVVDGFDAEQVWVGVDMQNGARMGQMGDAVDGLLDRLEGGGLGDLLAGGGAGSRAAKRGRDNSMSAAEEDVTVKKRRVSDDYEPDEGVDEETLQEEEEEGDGLAGETSSSASEGDAEGTDEDKDSVFDDPDFQHMSDSDGDDLPLFENAKSDEEDEDEEDSDDGEGAETARERKRREVEAGADSYMENAMKSLRTSNQRSQVEDDFFKLSEMEKFLDKEDAAEERKRLREEKGLHDDDNDEAEIDYFDGDGLGDVEEDERAGHQDYFGSLGDNGGSEEEEDLTVKEDEPGKGLDLLAGSDSEDEMDEDDATKSSFEQAQLRLKKKIEKMEGELVEEKPWQMKGEVAGPARPENSLLQEHLDYDNVAKQAPVITEEVSKRLEDIILQRVKDKAWDDVERKVKPVEDPYEYKKRLVLDQEKSKLSLAEVYEKEYLSQQSSEAEKGKVAGLMDEQSSETPKEVEEIKKSMRVLFAKLDTLAHFHYTPANLDPEIKIIKNLPSIAMEDVAPVGRSDASLLAPAEVQPAAKGDLIGREERTETDRKRERRKKKARQRAVREAKEKRQAAGQGSAQRGKKELAEQLKEKEKKGELKTMKDKGQDKAVKSSSAFFSQLQAETAKHLQGATEADKGKRRRSDGKAASGASFKL